MKLNLGCGHVQPAGWTNVDGSNRAWIASTLPWLDRTLVAVGLFPPTEFNGKTVFANLLKRFPWNDASAQAVYMGEILEHFTPAEADWIVSESFRVLAPGGIVRIRVPDHAQFWSNYVNEYNAIKQLPREQWTLDHTRWTRMYFGDICVRRPNIWQSMGHFHKWMYDDVSLTMLLESKGFRNVERAAFHESAIPGITEVEARDDLIIEARKP